MQQAQYKTTAELKYLARMQMHGRFGILMGTLFIPFLISLFLMQMISTPYYIINYALQLILNTILSVFQVGVCLIYMKCACNMPTKLGELFYGYQNNISVALKIGLLFVIIESVCMIPCDMMSIPILNTIEQMMPQVTDTTTVNEVLDFYNTFYIMMGKYYGVMLLCTLVAFFIKLVFVPAYYIMLDFPEWKTGKILKKSIEVMRGNKLRYVMLQISFIPAMLLSVFTCGLTLIWLVPYMSLANVNFYLDIMNVRNKTM